MHIVATVARNGARRPGGTVSPVPAYLRASTLGGGLRRREMGTLQMVASLVVGLPIGLYAWKAVMAVATQNSMIYARHSRIIEPERGRRDVSPPESAGFTAEQYRELELVTSDKVKLHAWIFLQPETQRRDAPTLIYLQGNAFDIGHRLPVFRMLLDRTSANVLALSYRGYGKSSGSPSETGLRLDALAAFAWLRSPAAAALGLAHDHRVFAYGHSLGGAVALALASDLQQGQRHRPTASPQLAGVVVENSFTSLSDMVDEIFPNWTVCKFFRDKSFVRLRRGNRKSIFKNCTSLTGLMIVSPQTRTSRGLCHPVGSL